MKELTKEQVEEQYRRYNNFSLESLEFKPDSKVLYKAGMLDPELDHAFVKMNNTEDKLFHPELNKHFEGEDNSELKEYAIAAMGYCEFMKISAYERVSPQEKDAFGKLSVFYQQYYNKVKSNIRVTGIKYTGQDKTAGIQLWGKYRILGSGKEVDFKTPVITLDATVYGFEDDLKKIVENIKWETFLYIFYNKVSYEPMNMKSND
jgi:hypothetical protein